MLLSWEPIAKCVPSKCICCNLVSQHKILYNTSSKLFPIKYCLLCVLCYQSRMLSRVKVTTNKPLSDKVQEKYLGKVQFSKPVIYSKVHASRQNRQRCQKLTVLQTWRVTYDVMLLRAVCVRDKNF